jgi:putative ABC transport system permease protein
LRGRDFTERDAADAQPVVIINQTMARRFWPDEDPIGRRLIIGETITHEIIGIVGDVKHQKLDGETMPEIYLHYLQRPSRAMTLAVRTEADPESLVSSIQTAVRQVDPDQPVYNVSTMEGRLLRSIARERFNALLLGIFAAVALILATVGIYSVMNYTVTQRAHEIGVRVALGAQAKNILALVLKQAAMLTLAGLTIGLFAALALTRLMASLLYGVSATDLLTFILIPVLLAVVALVASYVPARRAVKVDPMVALRSE